MRKIIIYITSLFPIYILSKFENLFSISQGKGFSNPQKEAELIVKFAKKKNIVLKSIFDVGAFHGTYTDEILKSYPESNFFLFEPDEVNFNFLEKKYSNLTNINLFNIAVSNKNEIGTLFSYLEGSQRGSLINQDFSHLKIEDGKYIQSTKINDHIKNDIHQTVKVTRIDTFSNDRKIDSIDLCKIDIEGNEMNAFEGMGEAIYKIKIIQFEFGESHIDSRVFFKSFFNFLKNKNFEIYRITPSRLENIKNYDEKLEHFRVTNFIAFNKN
jgi:FkbM family methyltransferase